MQCVFGCLLAQFHLFLFSYRRWRCVCPRVLQWTPNRYIAWLLTYDAHIMEKNTGPMPFIFYQDAYLWVLAYLTNEKKRLPERPSVLYVTRSSFIFSVVKFLWNRLSLRLFILLAFTFWSRNLAFFLLILCSEVVLLLTRFILFSREYQLNWELTTPRSELVCSKGLTGFQFCELMHR